jgi:hypothetical protein
MTQKQVESEVESWNWNLNIFEIYDEIRDYSERHQKQLLAYAYGFFNEDPMIKELAHHFGVDIIEE